MPRVGVELEYGGFLQKGEEYSSAFRYRLLIDLLQKNRHLLYTEFDGEISFGTPRETLAFNRIRHQIAILGYRYDLGNYYLGLHFYHRCYNPFKERGRLEGSLHRTLANTYYVGLELVDKAMLVGQKDRGLVFDPKQPFEWLWRWHVALSLNRVLFREFSELNWLFMGRLRLDLLRFHFLVPYLEAGGELLGMKEWRFTPKVEGGLRFHGHHLNFTSFIQWGRTQEWRRLYWGQPDVWFVSHSYVLGGGRLEFLLDQETLASGPSSLHSHLFPEVHGLAGYSLYLGSRYHLSLAEANLHLDVLRIKSLNLFSHLGLRISSIWENFAPDKVSYWLEYGLRQDWERFFVEGFVRHGRRLDAYQFRGLRESAHLAGGRLGTQGMRLGHYNDAISFKGPDQFQWLHQVNAQVSLAHYFDTGDWPFNWNLAAEARWDVLRWRFLVPYLAGGLEWLAARCHNQDALEYFVEPGLRFHGVMDLVFYYRFQHRETIKSYRGPTENQNLLGLRVYF